LAADNSLNLLRPKLGFVIKKRNVRNMDRGGASGGSGGAGGPPTTGNSMGALPKPLLQNLEEEEVKEELEP
jgi:hypothetical protein